MSISKQILKNMFSLSAAEFAGKGFAILFSLYLMRVIGPENNGIFTVAKSLIQALLVLVWLGFDQVGIREVAKDKSQVRKYVGTILTIRMVIALICYISLFIILELFAGSINMSSTTKIVTYTYGLLLFGHALLLNWVFQAVEKMHIIAIRSISVNLLNLLCVVIFVRQESDLLIAVWIIVITFMVNTIWMLYYYIKHYGMPKIKIDLKQWNGFFIVSLRVGFVFFIATLYNIANVQILSYYRGDYETGIFGAAFQIVVLIMIPTGILQGAFYPQIAKLNSGDRSNNIVSKYVLINILTGVFLAFSVFVFSDTIVDLLGEKYKNTNTVLKYLSMTVLIQYISTSYFSPLIAWNKENVVIYANLAGLIVNIPLNIILIPMYGYYGAAAATIGCEATVLIVLWVIFYKERGTLYLNNIIKSVLIALPVFSLGYIFVEYNLNIYIVFILTSILYLLSVLFFKIITIEEIKGIAKR
jgi:O-antigen/teichoic acid export membrane protein